MKRLPFRSAPTLSPESKATRIQELLEHGVPVRLRGVLYKDGDAVRRRSVPDALMRNGSHYRELDRDPVVPFGTLRALCDEMDDEEFHRVTGGWWRD